MAGAIRRMMGIRTPQDIAAAPVQSSVWGLPIPIVYGTAKVAGNLIQLPNPPSGLAAAGLAQNKKGQPKDIYCAVAIAIAEGPIAGIGYVWADKETGDSFGTYQNNGWNLVPGNGPTQSAWTAGGKITTANQRPYPYTAYVYNNNLDLPGYHLKNYAWEVNGLYSQPPAPTAVASTSGGTLASNTYTYAVTATINGVEQPASLTVAVPVTGPSGSVALTWPAVAGNTQYKVYRTTGTWTWQSAGTTNSFTDTGGAGTAATPPSGAYSDVWPYQVIYDLLTDPNHGLGWPIPSAAGSWLSDWVAGAASFGTYCIATGLAVAPVIDSLRTAAEWIQELLECANTAAVWSDGKLKMVPYGDTPITANGVTYTPNTTPLYNLTDNDYLSSGATDPVTVTRKKPTDQYNQVYLDYITRFVVDQLTGGNDAVYAPNFVIADDLAAITKVQAISGDNGLRPMPRKSLPHIKQAPIARTLAQLLLQRALYVVNEYRCKVGWKFSLLEPMDLITLTDSALGLATTTVRVTEVTEAADGSGIELVCEEWPFGVATAATYPNTPGGGYVSQANVAPGNTSAIIFDGPHAISTADEEIWIVASGGQFWGGCEVWYSLDNTTYYLVGAINGKGNFGALTSALNSTSTVYPSVDNVNTLAVDLTSSGGSLVGVSSTDFSNLNSLCYVDGEFVGFNNAALTTAFHYNLTALYRALYGSSAGTTHAIGSAFAFCGTAGTADAPAGVFRMPFPNAQLGQTVYFKFPAFNLFGLGLQSVASVSPVSHVIGQIPAGPGQTALVVKVARDSTTNPGAPGYNVTVYNNGASGANVTLAVLLSGQGSVSPNTNQTFTVAAGSNHTTNYVVTQPTPGQQPCIVSWTATASGFGEGYAALSVADAGQDASQMASLDINNDGSAILRVSLANTESSFKYAVATAVGADAATPSDATIAAGTLFSGRTTGSAGITVASTGTLAVGDGITVGIIPYVGGTQAGPSFAVHARRQTFSQQKTIYFSAANFLPTRSFGTGAPYAANYATSYQPGNGPVNNNALNFQNLAFAFTLPVGVTLVSAAVDLTWNTATNSLGGVTAALAKGGTTLQSGTATQTGAQTVSLALSGTTAAGDAFYFIISYSGNGGAGAAADVGQAFVTDCLITYTMPDSRKTY